MTEQADTREGQMVVVERDDSGKPTVWCDPEVAPLVAALNGAGFRTVASCSGHGKRPASIVLSDGREIIIAKDFDEARKIDGLFPGINGEPATIAAPAPVERVEQEAVAMLLIDDASVAESGDWDIEPIPAAIEKLARSGGATLPLYTTPQPAPTAAPAAPKVTSAMKAMFIGDFFWDEEAPYYDEDGELHDHVAQRVVPWDLCKRIYKEMAGFALANGALTPTAAQDVAGLVEFAVRSWHEQGANRPLANVHRRTLDSVWRQVIRFAGEDDVVLIGPRHDDMLDGSGNPLPQYATHQHQEQPHDSE